VVGVAATAGDALRQVEALRPDVILVDIFLGAESGLALAARLEEIDGEPAVILISTHAEGDVSALISGSGVAGFLPKAELSAEAVRLIVDGRTR
jgi:DNA-binding NarL/FixJ family response regulator